MAKKEPKPKREAPSVLGTLPAARPERLGAPRGRAKKPAAKRAPAKRKPPAKKPAAGPRAVRPGSPPLRTHAHTGPPPKPIGAPRGTELVTTAIRATGELAQIGFMVGGQALKRAIDRIPRP